MTTTLAMPIIVTIIITIITLSSSPLPLPLFKQTCFGPTVFLYICGYYRGLVASALLVIGHIPTLKYFRNSAVSYALTK